MHLPRFHLRIRVVISACAPHAQEGHPETPARVQAVQACLASAPPDLAPHLLHLPATRVAQEAELLRCHTRQYLSRLQQLSETLQVRAARCICSLCCPHAPMAWPMAWLGSQGGPACFVISGATHGGRLNLHHPTVVRGRPAGGCSDIHRWAACLCLCLTRAHPPTAAERWGRPGAGRRHGAAAGWGRSIRATRRWLRHRPAARPPRVLCAHGFWRAQHHCSHSQALAERPRRWKDPHIWCVFAGWWWAARGSACSTAV